MTKPAVITKLPNAPGLKNPDQAGLKLVNTDKTGTCDKAKGAKPALRQRQAEIEADLDEMWDNVPI